MATHIFSNQERLRLLEDLIAKLRREGNGEYNVTVALLGTICKELRAEGPGPADAAVNALEERIEAVQRSRTALGFDAVRVASMGMEFMGRWPVIKRALQGAKEQA